MDRPNIVVFFSDQQRWDTCGCYGQELPVTPNLDAMAAEGTRFEHAFTCQPVCGPARACIQTGRHASEIGVNVNHRMLPLEAPTIAKLLGQAGYETAYIGKWHLASCGPQGGPDDFRTRAVPLERRGGYRDFWLASDVLEFTSHAYDGFMFDGEGNRRVFPEGRFRSNVLTDWAVEYLHRRTPGRPFLLFLSFIEPHHQNDHGHYEGPRGSQERWKDFTPPADLIGHGGDWREEYPDYLGCIHALDENLGQIRTALEELDIADQTVLFFTSDHGSHFRTRNSEYKRSCHDGCLRIPFVGLGPGFQGGRVIREMISLIDLPPTLLRAGGLQPPEYMRGRPLQELLSNQARDWPDHVYAEISESHVGRLIRTVRWKYAIALTRAGEPHWHESFLYDLARDPHEQNNLAAEPMLLPIRQHLRKLLARQMIATGHLPPVFEPASCC